jgi:hypothetical protein
MKAAGNERALRLPNYRPVMAEKWSGSAGKNRYPLPNVPKSNVTIGFGIKERKGEIETLKFRLTAAIRFRGV